MFVQMIVKRVFGRHDLASEIRVKVFACISENFEIALETYIGKSLITRKKYNAAYFAIINFS